MSGRSGRIRLPDVWAKFGSSCGVEATREQAVWQVDRDEPATIASWLKGIDEGGDTASIQLREPVNKFPDFIRYIVQRLKALCPSPGKRKIAHRPARAGHPLGTTTAQRMLTDRATRWVPGAARSGGRRMGITPIHH